MTNFAGCYFEKYQSLPNPIMFLLLCILIFKYHFSGVYLEVCMPKCVLNCSLIANQGKYAFHPVTKVLVWEIGRIDITKLVNIKGTVSFLNYHNKY